MLQSVDSWSVTGKIGVRTTEQADSAVINQWQQNNTQFHVVLSSAILGLGKTVFQGTDKELYITTSEGETLYSEAPQQLLLQQTGWNIPLANIPYWIKAIPVPGKPYQIRFDTDGNPEEITQDGWTISASKYQRILHHHLPGKVTLSQSSNRVTLIIKTWDLAPL